MRELVGKFLHHIVYNLIFPITDQEHKGDGNDFWCLDWWCIEIAKCLYEGINNYIAYEPPYRLQHNKNFSKNKIINVVESKLQLLEKNQNKVIETARGLDTILASTVTDRKLLVYQYSPFVSVHKMTEEFLRNMDIDFVFVREFDKQFVGFD